MSLEFDNEFDRGNKNLTEQEDHHRPSLFGPIVLIAIGGYFLMLNAGLIPLISWRILLRLWPVLIIVAGLDVLLRRVRGFLGSLLGVFLALALIVGLGYLMVNYEDYPELFVPMSLGEPSYQHQDIAIGNVEEATVTIDMGPERSTISTIENAEDTLVSLDANTTRELELTMSGSGSEPAIALETSRDTFHVDDWPGWLLGMPPGYSDESGQETYVNVNVNPDVPMNLAVEGGSGSLDVYLSDATIMAMQMNAGSGSLNLWLPGEGHYDVEVECGSGTIDIILPVGLEARIEVVDDGSGLFGLSPDNAFDVIERGDNDEGVWETPGFQDAEHAATIVLDTTSGDVAIRYEND